MTLTSSGHKCDVCGKYILGLTEDDLVFPFKLTIIDQDLEACKTCIEIIKKLDGGNWKELPEGPLRKVYEEADVKP